MEKSYSCTQVYVHTAPLSALNLIAQLLLIGTSAYLDEVSAAFLGYLNEGVTCHVLYSIVGLVHELKQLVHHSL